MVDGRIIRNTPVWASSLLLFLFPLLLLFCLNLLFEGESIDLETWDWILVAVSSISGLLLVIQRKRAWAISVSVLVLTVVLEFARAYQLFKLGRPFDYQLILGSASFIIVFYIIYFFRFPYLDGRDTGLFGIAHRYDVNEKTTLQTEDGLQIYGEVLNISYSGVLFRSTQALDSLNFADPVELSIESLGLKGVRSSIRSIEGDFLRIKFTWLGYSQMMSLRKIMTRFQSRTAPTSAPQKSK